MRATIIVIATLFAPACTPPAANAPEAQQTQPAPAPVDPAIAAVVEAAMPGVTIVSGAADGEGEYEVTGMAGGQEYEFDLMGPDGGWRVIEIQRDIAWGDAPAPVRNVVATAPNAFLPERVVESRQPADGSVVYELFAPGAPDAPAMEVRFMDGEAAIMPPAH
jgi:hypothetical protein